MKTLEVHFTLNNQPQTLITAAGRTLLEVIREDFGLTGAKDACSGEGECGACTVLLDGAPVNSCLVLISQVEGHRVLTIEGLAPSGQLHPIQLAFIATSAIQCGYCTPGMVLATKALLDRTPVPTDAEIQEALAGNLCRCTGHTKIISGVKLAAQEVQHGR